jgi:hypothetical protein
VARRSPGQVAGLGRGLIGLSRLSVLPGPIAQLVEHMAGSHEVRGSNPLGSTFRGLFELGREARPQLGACSHGYATGRIVRSGAVE